MRPHAAEILEALPATLAELRERTGIAAAVLQGTVKRMVKTGELLRGERLKNGRQWLHVYHAGTRPEPKRRGRPPMPRVAVVVPVRVASVWELAQHA